MQARGRKNGGSVGRALRALAAVLLFALPGTAAAQVVTFTSAIASWRDAQDNVPGSQPGDPVITNGVPTSRISWGSSTPQSGYDVTITIPDPNQFPVADFSHRNFTVPSPSLTSVVLDFVLDFDVDGSQTGPLTFTFTFTHEETPNNLDPCPYPTPPGEGCTDRVIFFEAPDPTTFTIDGKTYTLGLSFLNPSGDPIGEFITREGGTINTADLDTEFALVPPVLEMTKSGPATLTLAKAPLHPDVQNTGPTTPGTRPSSTSCPTERRGPLRRSSADRPGLRRRRRVAGPRQGPPSKAPTSPPPMPARPPVSSPSMTSPSVIAG